MRLSLLLTAVSVALLTACNPVIETEFCMNPRFSQISVKVTNQSTQTITTNSVSFTSDQVTHDITGGESISFNQEVLQEDGCEGLRLPLNYLLLRNSGQDVEQAKALFGITHENYQTWANNYPKSNLAKATLHAHSLFFAPGRYERQGRGLVVNNPTGTEIFTSLDPWRPYKFEGFTLNIDVYDLDAGDIRMSVTGTLAN